uniref:Uncharacterized protein n=1 Tax=Timema monikensis TaxID=170555 RepID=A0A7R9E7S6_9NEOP|nr:unnamed protein product [Timema monikensis]
MTSALANYATEADLIFTMFENDLLCVLVIRVLVIDTNVPVSILSPSGFSVKQRRPRLEWWDELDKDLARLEVSRDWRREALDRSRWKQLVKAALDLQELIREIFGASTRNAERRELEERSRTGVLEIKRK